MLRAEETSHVPSLKINAFHNSNPPTRHGSKGLSPARCRALGTAEIQPRALSTHEQSCQSQLPQFNLSLRSCNVELSQSIQNLAGSKLLFCISFFKSFFYRYILIGSPVWRSPDDSFQKHQTPRHQNIFAGALLFEGTENVKNPSTGKRFCTPTLGQHLRGRVGSRWNPACFLRLEHFRDLGDALTRLFSHRNFTNVTFLILFHLFITFPKRSAHGQGSRLAFCQLPGEPYEELRYAGAQERGGSSGKENQGPFCRQKP